jgi:tRNA nucleotidyltransferase (CCA-adding enzyme)
MRCLGDNTSVLSELPEVLDAALPVALRHITYRIRDAAQALDLRAALVGGIPRELARIKLGQLPREQFASTVRDFDVVVEGPVDSRGGPGVRLAYELTRRLPGKLVINEAFHTATLETADPARIDLTSARTEAYPLPGGLPVVDISLVNIETDLSRRDFAVNALAIDLTASGRLIDTTGGVGDLREKSIRVLHSASFQNDPTRLLRALRYSMRLGYDLEPATRVLFQSAIDDGVLDVLSPERVRNELECIAGEEHWQQLWAVMDITGITRSLHPALHGISALWELEDGTGLDISIRNQSGLLTAEDLAPWLVRTAWVLHSVPASALFSVGQRIGLHKHDLLACRSALEILHTSVPQLSLAVSPSQVVQELEHYPRRGIALALFIFQPRTESGVAARKHLKAYLEDFSFRQSFLSGHELLALGLQPGKTLGRIQTQLRYLRLDGVIKDEQAERELAKQLIAAASQPGEEE